MLPVIMAIAAGVDYLQKKKEQERATRQAQQDASIGFLEEEAAKYGASNSVSRANRFNRDLRARNAQASAANQQALLSGLSSALDARAAKPDAPESTAGAGRAGATTGGVAGAAAGGEFGGDAFGTTDADIYGMEDPGIDDEELRRRNAGYLTGAGFY